MMITLIAEHQKGFMPNMEPKRALAARICATMFSTMPIAVRIEVTRPAVLPYSVLIISCIVVHSLRRTGRA